VTVHDAQVPFNLIPNAKLSVKPMGLEGTTDANGTWSFTIPDFDTAETVTVKANGFSFKPDHQDVNQQVSIPFISEEYTFKVSISLNLDGVKRDEIPGLLNSISISVDPKASMDPPQNSGTSRS